MSDRVIVQQRPQTAPTAGRPHAPRTPGRFGTPWAVAAVFIVGILVAGIPFGVLVVTWGRTVAEGPARAGAALTQMAADAMRPHIEVHQLVLSSLQDLQRRAKLVVLEPVVNADITRQEGSSSWGMYWGTNVARVTVEGARTQYVIDLDKMQSSDFIMDNAANVLRVLIPKPHLDTDMVSIDPSKIQTVDLRGGWARWDKQDTKERAIAELKPGVIVQATKPFVRREANEAGLAAMKGLLQPMAAALRSDGVGLDIRYPDD